MDNYLDNIIKIQHFYKNKKIKRKIILFSKLPDDIWRLILRYLNKKYYHKTINFVIEYNIFKIFWLPHKNENVKKAFKSLNLVKKYYNFLHISTIKKSLQLSIKMLSIRYLNIIQILYINAFIEFINTKKIL